jgi:GNAT superfamily N-acetyltransferase
MDRKSPEGPTLRLAQLEDVEAIETLMRGSIEALFPPFYDAAQTAASAEHFASIDPVVIRDGTYFVMELDGELVASGGWTRRPRVDPDSDGSADGRILDPATEPARIRLTFVRGDWTRRGLATRILEASEAAAKAEGYRRLELGASLPGVPLYLSYGFRETERIEVPVSDGLAIAIVLMAKPIA